MQTPGDLLRNGIRDLGLTYTEEQIASFLTYLTELKKWNKAYNLTGAKNDREIIIKHFLDSLLFSKVLPPCTQTVADIGSGGGFPGIPVKIMNPRLRVFLVEPTQKKAVFLQHIYNKLGLRDIEIINKRIEEAEGLKVDAAMTRALFSVREFIEKAGKILNKDGVLILSKGPKLEEELKGLDMSVTVTDLKLPFEETVRHLVVVKGG